MINPIVLIVVAQLLGTSLWFSANASADDLMRAWGLTVADLGRLTIAVQAGFVVGTLSLAFSGLADRFAASRIFAVSAVIGAAANTAFAVLANDLTTAIWFRFLTGLALGGIYPLGMKLIVSWSPAKTGAALGWLVGMLTLGTALPQLVRGLGTTWPSQAVTLTSSLLALVAAAIIRTLGDGPHLPKQGSQPLQFGRVLQVVRSPGFRAAALGYFGHMWELYAFWTIVPVLVAPVLARTIWTAPGAVSLASFAIIGIGAIGCVLGGRWSRTFGSARVAAAALATSGAICLIYPLAQTLTPCIAGSLLLIWGLVVVADSPQFSSLSAANCPPELVGSALAIQNSIGFLITIVAIGVATAAIDDWGPKVTWLLLPGPIIGLVGMRILLWPKPR